MKLLNFNSQHLDVDWISFNIQGLADPQTIASNLSDYFTVHGLMDNVPSVGFHGLKKKYKVSIRPYTESNGYWVGTKIIFSGKVAAYFYKLIQTQRFDWDLLNFDQKTISLGRIDLCFSRSNDWSHTSKSFDGFWIFSGFPKSDSKSYDYSSH